MTRICTGEVWVRRMGGGHVEGLEVVPVGLHLGPLVDGVAHADEEVFQLVAGAGDGVEVAGEPGSGDFGEVEALVSETPPPLGGLELRSPGSQGFLEPGTSVVYRATRLAALLGRHGPQLLV